MEQTHFVEEIASFLEIPPENAFSSEKQGDLYVMAYQSYEGGDYESAAQFFTKLVLCDPFSGKYWYGLASSRQMQMQYLAAIHAWSLVALLEEKDPLPHFHAAECLFSLNEKEEALKALHAAETLTDTSPLRDKIKTLKKVHCE